MTIFQLGISSQGQAIAWKISSNSAVMQQPTSHYYHYCYGLDIDVSSADQRIGWRIQYIERPEFSSGGFKDKEYLSSSLLMSKLTKRKNHGLHAGFGIAQLNGYIKSENGDINGVSERTVTMNGPSASIEYAGQYAGLSGAIFHQTFIGYVSQKQIETRVAWPYNFFGIKIGYQW
jgi:hypothetical protein